MAKSNKKQTKTVRHEISGVKKPPKPKPKKPKK
jgi:hypothetical protein